MVLLWCLDHMIILNERELYRVVKGYTAFYNDCRPYQGIDQRVPCSAALPRIRQKNGESISIPVLGGLYHDYRRVA